MIKNLILKTRIPLFFKLVFGKYPDLKQDVDYDVYWASKRGGKSMLTDFQKNRINIILKHIDNNSTLLDIAAGDVALLKYAQKHKKFKKITATDISSYVLKRLKKEGIDTLNLGVEDITGIQKLKKQDYILMLEILEHIKNPETILLETLKKANKKLIFSLPNTGYIAHRLRLLFGSFPLQWRTNPGEHLRYWTKRDMKWWLKQLKLYDKSTIILYEGIPILNKLWPSLFAMGIIVIIEK